MCCTRSWSETSLIISVTLCWLSKGEAGFIDNCKAVESFVHKPCAIFKWYPVCQMFLLQNVLCQDHGPLLLKVGFENQ